MIVTSVTKIDSRRQKVVLDNEYVFSLYNSEIRKYNIEPDCQITEGFISDLSNEVLYPRAKERALYLVGSRDRTRKQLEDKLKESFYSEEIIEKVLAFLTSYGYIDDERFASNYIKMKKNSKSRRQIECELMRKGINSSIIKQVVLDEYEDGEMEAIKCILNKTKYKTMLEDKSSRNKVITSLLRRGFEYEQITRCIDEIKV